MNVNPDGEAPAFSCWRRCPQADVEGTPDGASVLRSALWAGTHFLVFSSSRIRRNPSGVPSTFPRCGGDLLQQEKAFLASLRGYTFIYALRLG